LTYSATKLNNTLFFKINPLHVFLHNRKKKANYFVLYPSKYE